jgi:hypothetical protein
MLRHAVDISKWQQISLVRVATFLHLASSHLVCSHYDFQAQGRASRAECVDF